MKSISDRTVAYTCWSLAVLGVLGIVASWVVAKRAAEETVRQIGHNVDLGSSVLVVAAVMVFGPGSVLLTLTGEAFWRKWRVREVLAVLSTAYVAILMVIAIAMFFR
jgi:hypothetical protein